MRLLKEIFFPEIIVHLSKELGRSFKKKTTLDELVTTIFPEKEQAFAIDFFHKYFSNGQKPIISLYLNAINNAQEFFQYAALDFYEIPEDKGGYWKLGDCGGRFESEIIIEKKSHYVIYKNDTQNIVVADSFLSFVDKVVGLKKIANMEHTCSIDQVTKTLLNEMCSDMKFDTAIKIYSSFQTDPDLCYIDFIDPKALTPQITKNNFYYRANFAFDFSFRQADPCHVPDNGWWVIGYGADDEDTGPDEGLILIHDQTGKIAYRSAPLPNYITPQKTKFPHLPESMFFVIADGFCDFVDKLKLHGWEVDRLNACI